MRNGLVIVESPAKAKTLSNFLGPNFDIIASYGHVRDLVSKPGSVDTNNHFKMLWEFSDRGKKQIQSIIQLLKSNNNVYLATDPDREGEAISWHILEILNDKKLLKNKTIKRVVFHEITKSAVTVAFDNPRELNQDLVNAYLARRLLDYLVGFSLSPVLWKKLPGAKSAGRVQSVALRLIANRELEIQKFRSEEYWSIHNIFAFNNKEFNSNLIAINDNKLNKLDIKNEKQAEEICQDLSTKKFTVIEVEKKSTKRNPYPPFTTSTLQQEASKKLGFSAKYTMQLAQKLYEGINIKNTTTGLITYMRTDSTNLSEDIIKESRDYINSTFNSEYLPKNPNLYKTKTKNAQEAHEAIRPTSCLRTIEELKEYLNPDELKLYELIWRRTIASQMSSAVWDQVVITINSTDNKYQLKSVGSTLKFDGYLAIYKQDEDNKEEQSQNAKLPIINKRDILETININKSQHFTQPPAKYTEAGLVKKMEELGIGRPSTYATIINVIQERKYALLQKKAFCPEPIGIFVSAFLEKYFTKYVEYDFTANLEEELDDISNGKRNWEDVLNNFWLEFNTQINTIQDTISVANVFSFLEQSLDNYIFQNISEKTCTVCNNGTMTLKLGKFGAFLGCSNYPKCTYRIPIGKNASITNNVEDQLIGTDANNDSIFLKNGPYGYYLEWELTKSEKDKTKPKRLSIPKFLNPTELDNQQLLLLASLPKQIDKQIILNIGKFGPYVSINENRIPLPKTSEFLNLENVLNFIQKHDHN